MSKFIEDGKRFSLTTPSLLPNSAGYLWNRHMMIHMNCQGYAVAQYMNPEPKKYAHIPALAATSFMQPEQPYFAHHPGRFFYIRDDETGEIFSVPFAPMKTDLDSFKFEPGLSDIRWQVEHLGVNIEVTLTLSESHVVELWNVKVTNLHETVRKLSVIPYFPVGYSSWMNMGAHFDRDLNAVVCTSITPYQKLEQYEKNKHLKDITYLTSDVTPDYYELSQPTFEGQGGLHNPDALKQGANLSNGDAIYEIPACIMQFCIELEEGQSKELNLMFGPALDNQEISTVKEAHTGSALTNQHQQYKQYVEQGCGVIDINTPDKTFNDFVNHWLPRQVFYHGDTNRLTTDPQTRNYLQDGMGMAYVDSQTTKKVILTALAQQKSNGEMPDGILLTPEAELKYINQIPHTDHSVWLAIILQAYLNETNDWAILDHQLAWEDDQTPSSVLEHMNRAMAHLCSARDERGLPFIAQGDWCDPMNMVGPKGVGVSGWLTQALSYALQIWIETSRDRNSDAIIAEFEQTVSELKEKTNEYFWKGDWYARGITDDGVTFGIPEDKEGRIFLNTQSWAFLAGIPTTEQKQKMLHSVDEQLDTPYGVMLYAPAFTSMREDVGRVTQKWPGSAENGSVYNHAAAFYAASLYAIDEADRGFSVLRKMVSDQNDEGFERRGQLPVYIPNYYRGAFYQFPTKAGRSSNLFNTGTGAWFYRMVIEQLFGLRGCEQGLLIEPQLPSDWNNVSVTRQFRGATFNVSYHRSEQPISTSIVVDGTELESNIIGDVISGKVYEIVVSIGR
ncbi:NdvB protein [Vibrio sp. ZSDE26]|uniref:NdvB protein n=1 Tax=Vibrio amylolyticus TaxID=2847292 RepID=A0A9X1XI56_9VIBR|nr:NdvB protein [Vibrio amylolyticus]MCK6263399.1 NdvB protein [Vibrio amylolyticus]